jgi:hypothetical protein
MVRVKSSDTTVASEVRTQWGGELARGFETHGGSFVRVPKNLLKGKG